MTMEAKQSQVARILNTASSAFFTGLDKEDQNSLFGVLEEYFVRKILKVGKQLNAAEYRAQH